MPEKLYTTAKVAKIFGVSYVSKKTSSLCPICGEKAKPEWIRADEIPERCRASSVHPESSPH